MMRNDGAANMPAAVASRTNATRQKVNLSKDAIKLALEGRWQQAAEANRAILELFPDDCEAGNRLAKALMECGEFAAARRVLQRLCQLSPSNNIARKNLARLEKLEQDPGVASKSTMRQPHAAGNFIEEGGKSCTTTLRPSAEALGSASTSAGEPVILSVSNRQVLAFTGDGRHLGSVEPSLGRRLRKLIAGGNRYSAVALGTGPEGLSVIIREASQHPSLRNVVSFSARQTGVPGRSSAETVQPGTLHQESLPEDFGLGESAVSASGADDESEVLDLLTAGIEEDPTVEQDDGVPVLETEPDEPVLPVFAAANEPDWD